jgi:hypothetical protein
LLAESRAEIERYEQECDAFEAWAKKHRDGYEGKDAHGKDVKFEPEDVRDRLDDVRSERARLVPKAEALLEKREAGRTEAKKLYPGLYERGSRDYLAGQRILLEVPGLRMAPNGMRIVGEILAGRKARLDAAAGKPADGKSVKQPPKGPNPSRAPGKPVSEPGKKKATGFDAERFRKAGASSDALEEQVLGMLG